MTKKITEKFHNPALTLKAVRHQWYWIYEYSDFTKLEFDPYIIPQEDRQTRTFRLLDTDNRIVLTNKFTNPNNHNSSRRTTLMDDPKTRTKDRSHTRL